MKAADRLECSRDRFTRWTRGFGGQGVNEGGGLRVHCNDCLYDLFLWDMQNPSTSHIPIREVMWGRFLVLGSPSKSMFFGVGWEGSEKGNPTLYVDDWIGVQYIGH
ncbi:unnamed protein product [Ectocarpus sp. 6 AP-2014]